MSSKKLYIFVLALSILGYAWVAWNLLAGTSGGGSVCLFRQVTHVPCPSCGATRALLALMRGELSRSLLLNPLGALLSLGMIVIPPWIIIDWFRGNDSFHRWYIAAERMFNRRMWLSVAGIAALLINWVWTITKGL